MVDVGGNIRVGIIGAGLQGQRRAQSLKQDKRATLAIVADTQYDRAELLADDMGCQATANWKEVVNSGDVDIVIVCTPPNLHSLMCIAAMREGKHVLCEKPLARNSEEAVKIVNVAREKGVKLKCGFNLRHHPGIWQAKAWLDEGIIGDPINLRFCYGIGGEPGYDKNWRMDSEVSGGGQLMDQGVHVLDLSRYFLGEFTEAFGTAQTTFWDIAPLEDNVFAILRTGKGQVASFHVSWTQWKNLFTMDLFGREGYISVKGLGGSYGIEKAILGKRDFLKPFREEIIEYRGGDSSWYEEWKEFVSAIKENREPMGNGHDGLEALKLASTIYETIQTNQVTKT